MNELQRTGPAAIQDFEARALAGLREALGINVYVRLVEPRQIERSQGKAVT